MSLYKENQFNFIKNKKLILIIIGIIIIALLIIFVITKINWDNILKENPIDAKFQENPLNVLEKTNSVLKITIKNNTDEDVTNAVININSNENIFFIYCKDSDKEINIPIISKNTERTIYCDVRPNDAKEILEGTYSFNINYILDKEIYTKILNLEIIKK